jgi:hypothetical protein
MDTTAGIRVVIALGEMRNSGICLVALDFASAFDKISHEYLFRPLESDDYGDHIVRMISSLYTEAYSPVYINGWPSMAFPIQCSVRQGCPLSMVLFTLASNPLLVLLDRMLEVLKIGRRTVKFTSLAYADDVTVLVTSKDDRVNLRDAIRIYERATGARLSLVKTKVIPIGAWDTTEDVLNIPYTT